MYINGAGGVEKDLLMGYSDNQLIMFKNNAAGFAGGAIDVSLVAHPTTLPSVLKTVQIQGQLFNCEISVKPVDHTADVSGAVTVININNRDTAGTAVEHCQKCGKTVETGSVTY